MNKWIKTCALAVFSLALAGPALACQGDKVLYSDDFSFADAAWGPLGPSFNIANDTATVKPDANGTALHWNPNFTFSDADMCVTVTSSDITDATNAYAGLMFWVKDNQNFFAYVYATNGYFEVVHYLNGNWTPLSPVPWTKTDAIKQGLDVANTLRVTIKGQIITLGVNGTEVARFRAQTPDADTSVGMFAASETAKANTFAFQNLKVTNVVDTPVAASPTNAPAVAAAPNTAPASSAPASAAPLATAPAVAASAPPATTPVATAPTAAAASAPTSAAPVATAPVAAASAPATAPVAVAPAASPAANPPAQTAAACSTQKGATIFEDAFKDNTGGWAYADNDLVLKTPGAQLMLQPSTGGYINSSQNQTFNATEGDYCMQMSFPPNAQLLTDPGIGLEFLASDYQNYFMAEVYYHGKISLFHKVDDKWSTVWETSVNDLVKTGANDANEVRVTVKGTTITVFVNGRQIREVRAQIPTGDLKFGFFAEYGNVSKDPVVYGVDYFRVTAGQ